MENISKKIQEFEENEKIRIKKKLEDYEIKCERRLADIIANNQRIVKELEEIHVIIIIIIIF